MPLHLGKISVLTLFFAAAAAPCARAEDGSNTVGATAPHAHRSLFSPDAGTRDFRQQALGAVSFLPAEEAATPASRARLRLADGSETTAPAEQAPPPRAFVYSDGYETRAAIHKKASLAMLPLFAAEAYLGQQMFNNPTGITTGKQTAHKYIGMGIGSLFAVNTVTGAMNLWEGRKDPSGIMKRTIHATLMMMADVGFVATAMTRPNSSTLEGVTIYDAKKNQHMAIAYASVTAATIGYVMMLLH